MTSFPWALNFSAKACSASILCALQCLLDQLKPNRCTLAFGGAHSSANTRPAPLKIPLPCSPATYQVCAARVKGYRARMLDTCLSKSPVTSLTMITESCTCHMLGAHKTTDLQSRNIQGFKDRIMLEQAGIANKGFISGPPIAGVRERAGARGKSAGRQGQRGAREGLGIVPAQPDEGDPVGLTSLANSCCSGFLSIASHDLFAMSGNCCNTCWMAASRSLPFPSKNHSDFSAATAFQVSQCRISWRPWYFSFTLLAYRTIQMSRRSVQNLAAAPSHTCFSNRSPA